MGRGMTARRRMARAPAPAEDEIGAEAFVDDSESRADRLDEEAGRLQAELTEVEAWYRLLRADHASLQARHGQVGRKNSEIRAEADRLRSRIRELEALADRPDGSGRVADHREQGITMMTPKKWPAAARRHKWATAALFALATLVARDPAVQALFASAIARVRQAGKGDGSAADAASNGYVRYAAMIQARDEADRARAEYNAHESTLKGDALLEAQDRLRAAKVRYRRARLAFLPELAARCELAHLPVPQDAARELALLGQEARD